MGELAEQAYDDEEFAVEESYYEEVADQEATEETYYYEELALEETYYEGLGEESSEDSYYDEFAPEEAELEGDEVHQEILEAQEAAQEAQYDELAAEEVVHEEPPHEDHRSTIPCSYFRRGCCTLGSGCMYKHS